MPTKAGKRAAPARGKYPGFAVSKKGPLQASPRRYPRVKQREIAHKATAILRAELQFQARELAHPRHLSLGSRAGSVGAFCFVQLASAGARKQPAATVNPTRFFSQLLAHNLAPTHWLPFQSYASPLPPPTPPTTPQLLNWCRVPVEQSASIAGVTFLPTSSPCTSSPSCSWPALSRARMSSEGCGISPSVTCVGRVQGRKQRGIRRQGSHSPAAR